MFHVKQCHDSAFCGSVGIVAYPLYLLVRQMRLSATQRRRVPALFWLYRNARLGINKLVEVRSKRCCNRFLGKVRLLNVALLLPSGISFVLLGACFVAHVPASCVRKFMPLISLTVASYTSKKRLSV
jgi:hypothetical protein